MQTLRNATQRQTPPHLPSTSISHSRPLPNIPFQIPLNSQSYTSQNEQHRPFYLHNEQNRPFYSHNNQNRHFYDTNRHLPSHNNQQRPFYDTNFPFSSTYNKFPPGPPVYHTSSTHHKTSIFSLPLLYRLLVIPSFRLCLLSKNHQLLPLRISPFLQGGRTGVHGLKR